MNAQSRWPKAKTKLEKMLIFTTPISYNRHTFKLFSLKYFNQHQRIARERKRDGERMKSKEAMQVDLQIDSINKKW